MPRTFGTTVRVRLSETDAQGVVYYGHYLTYFDVARLEMLRKVGLTLGFLRRRGLMFVAAGSTCRYMSSALLDDLLRLRVSVARLGTSSVVYDHVIIRGRTKVAEGRVTDVLVGRDGRPTAIPDEVRARLSRYST